MRDDLLLAPRFLDQTICQKLSAVEYQPPAGRHDVEAIPLYGEALVHPLVHRVSDALAKHFEISEPLFCDYAAATRSGPGMGHPLHADAEQLDGTPNHTPWRLVTAMLYLGAHGSDFAGGELVFPGLGATISPEAGLLVGFRCDAIHAHQVPPVQWGVRRAIAFWFTTKRSWAGNVAPVYGN